MSLPNFLIIGAQKSGTTWLNQVLRSHPQVFMPSYEVHFFNDAKNYPKGRSWYESHFTQVSQHHIAVGEKTPGYISFYNDRGPNTAERIHRLIPNAKLIAVLRNPVDRILSSINHSTVRGRFDTNTPLDDILKVEIENETRHIQRGYYYRGIARYLNYFHRDQILIFIYERDMRRDSAKRETASQACRFLGVNHEFDFDNLYRRYNRNSVSKQSLLLASYLRIPRASRLWRGLTMGLDRITGWAPYKPTASKEVRQQLHELYAPENEKLFEFLGYRIPEWEFPQGS